MARKPVIHEQNPVKPVIVEVPVKSKEELAAMTAEEKKAYHSARSKYRQALIDAGETVLGRKPVPEDETSNERFIRLAQDRVTAIRQKINLLANLSNRSQYDYTDDDVEQIFDTLADDLLDCRKQFQAKSKTKPTFVLLKKK